ncbi:hypothetical protein K435DRAFT_789697 [Dendrothele bispora CBS 962.96]|uniref:Uncharacterized protein n=1 Tax=Dendrothele bispora (strain CBS 962.96) TaxID=1314807 RepID=A0A4S8MSI2_DENBC|nr:hypothetical protein K435DRAFT_789697 [Dendrothele bispora CBS 962.96]
MSSKHQLDIKSESLRKRPRLNAKPLPPSRSRAVKQVTKVEEKRPHETQSVISIHSDGPEEIETAKVEVISIDSDGPRDIETRNVESQENINIGDDDDYAEEVRLMSRIAAEAWHDSVRDVVNLNKKTVSDVAVQTDPSLSVSISPAQLVSFDQLLTDLQNCCNHLREKFDDAQRCSNIGWSKFRASDAQCRYLALERDQARKELDKANETKEKAITQAEFWKKISNTGEKISALLTFWRKLSSEFNRVAGILGISGDASASPFSFYVVSSSFRINREVFSFSFPFRSNDEVIRNSYPSRTETKEQSNQITRHQEKLAMQKIPRQIWVTREDKVRLVMTIQKRWHTDFLPAKCHKTLLISCSNSVNPNNVTTENGTNYMVRIVRLPISFPIFSTFPPITRTRLPTPSYQKSFPASLPRSGRKYIRRVFLISPFFFFSLQWLQEERTCQYTIQHPPLFPTAKPLSVRVVSLEFWRIRGILKDVTRFRINRIICSSRPTRVVASQMRQAQKLFVKDVIYIDGIQSAFVHELWTRPHVGSTKVDVHGICHSTFTYKFTRAVTLYIHGFCCSHVKSTKTDTVDVHVVRAMMTSKGATTWVI